MVAKTSFLLSSVLSLVLMMEGACKANTNLPTSDLNASTLSKPVYASPDFADTGNQDVMEIESLHKKLKHTPK